MKISIITVTLNNKSGLLRAIKSVRSQSYKNVEHIIVDGGSKDGSVEILKQIQDDSERFITPSGIRNDISLSSDYYSLVFISEKDNGIYDAINKGIKLATGDVIGLLHSDDFYADEFVLERYAEVFQDKSIPSSSFQSQSPDLKDQERFLIPLGIRNDKKYVEAVYSDLVYVSHKSKGRSQPYLSAGRISNVKSQKSKVEDNEDTDNHMQLTDYSVIRMWKTQKEEFTTEAQRHREFLKGWMPPHPTLFVRREVFEKYGFYRMDMKIAADYEMILRLFFNNKITSYYLPITTYCMTIGGASNKSLKNILRKSYEDFYAMKLHGIPFPLKTLLLKNFRKLPQFFNKSK
ncbi:MAG: glycosyltransferase family 2 protein [Ignavibacterium sp.]